MSRTGELGAVSDTAYSLEVTDSVYGDTTVYGDPRTFAHELGNVGRQAEAHALPGG